ncbi:M23 family metallopeptidase [Mesorhizobium sp. M0895]|uniref:M23 family metallopeptidase n=1 Tax=Mesorhizobium sp. M0895 TaxID=2957019 RepID=UPI0033361986
MEFYAVAEAEHYAPHLFDPRPPQAGTRPYPTQSKLAPTKNDLAGELRGYYGRPEFNPKSSRFGKVRSGGTKNHGGVDIYASYLPFPHETAVYAICEGRVEFFYDNESPDDIGNRAWLYPKHAPNDRVIFGHLNRFVGHDRGVKKGCLIGFAGCSGNADADHECTTLGVLNINSGHVHMAYRPAKGGPVDPVGKVGWSLRFADIEKAIELKTWTNDGNLLDKPAPPDFRFGLLRTDNAKRTERIKKADDPSQLPAPFETIDFDNRKAVAKTAKFYELAGKRLATAEPTHPKAKFKQFGIADFRKSLAALSILIGRLNDIIAELDEISKAAVTAETPSDIKRAHTRSAEFMFDAIRLLWFAMAGEAMLPVAKDPGKVYDKVKKAWVPVPGGPWDGHVPRSGIGLWGKSMLVGLGNGRAALQASFLKDLVDDTTNSATKKIVPYSKWTLSVSLGAGTSWHAIFDEKFEAEVGKLPAETAKIFSEYFISVYNSVQLVSHISKIICDNAKIVDQPGLKRYLSSIKVIMGVLVGEAEEPGEARKLQSALEEIGKKDDLILTLLAMIAKTAGDAAKQAAKCLDPKEKQLDRIRSAYDMIWIEPSE